MRTLNTGIVTVLNYGQRVPPAVSAITFAHEAGHNFGSNVSNTKYSLGRNHFLTNLKNQIRLPKYKGSIYIMGYLYLYYLHMDEM